MVCNKCFKLSSKFLDSTNIVIRFGYTFHFTILLMLTIKSSSTDLNYFNITKEIVFLKHSKSSSLTGLNLSASYGGESA